MTATRREMRSAAAQTATLVHNAHGTFRTFTLIDTLAMC